jgi:hypothetical protein
MKKVNLTISENYVSNWGFWEAMREILQNAIDSEGMTVQKKESSGSIVINNDGALSLSTLMLGESSKRDDCESIGKYGEGYKLALLVLCRAGYSVSVKTVFEIWTPTIEKHPQLGVNSLCINIQETDCEHKGVEFSVFNLSGDDFTALDEKFICSESVEVVASAGGSYCFEEWDEENKRLFVGGLFVCDLGEDYKYSWSFAPNILELDRDRSSANGFHVDLEATKM